MVRWGRALALVATLLMAALMTGGAAQARSHARQAQADRPWMNTALGADRRADLLLRAMTLQEKAELMSNDPGSPYAYYNAPIERLGIPALKMFDAGAGLRLGGVTLPDTGN